MSNSSKMGLLRSYNWRLLSVFNIFLPSLLPQFWELLMVEHTMPYAFVPLVPSRYFINVKLFNDDFDKDQLCCLIVYFCFTFLNFSSTHKFTLKSCISISGFLKHKTGSNGVTYAKPHATKLRLNYSFSSPRNGIVNQSAKKYLISTS